KEIREIDRALNELIRALEHEQKQHHPKHHAQHKGSAIHKGMQIAGKNHQPPASTTSTAANKATSTGQLSRAMTKFGYWHEEWERDRKHHHEWKEDRTTSTPKTNSGSTVAGTTSSGTSSTTGTSSSTTTLP